MSEISKTSSLGEYDNGVCDCNKRVRYRTSWTVKNPGRRFQTCAKSKDEGGCDFFMWIDDGPTGRAKDIINELNQKKNIIEEKLKILEEELKIAEEKLMIAEEKLKIAHEKLCRLTLKRKRNEEKKSKFCEICIVLLLFVGIVLFLSNKMIASTDRKYLV